MCVTGKGDEKFLTNEKLTHHTLTWNIVSGCVGLREAPEWELTLACLKVEKGPRKEHFLK